MNIAGYIALVPAKIYCAATLGNTGYATNAEPTGTSRFNSNIAKAVFYRALVDTTCNAAHTAIQLIPLHWILCGDIALYLEVLNNALIAHKCEQANIFIASSINVQAGDFMSLSIEGHICEAILVTVIYKVYRCPIVSGQVNVCAECYRTRIKVTVYD